VSRALAGLAALAVAVSLGACGGGGAKAKPDPEAAADAVTGFTKAFAAGDGAKACDLLTSAAAAAFVKRAQVSTGARDCPTSMKRVAELAGSSVTDPLSKATVGEVKVTGDRAATTVTASGHSTAVTLSKEDGAWKLNGVPGI
jgi:hypothetical protein